MVIGTISLATMIQSYHSYECAFQQNRCLATSQICLRSVKHLVQATKSVRFHSNALCSLDRESERGQSSSNVGAASLRALADAMADARLGDNAAPPLLLLLRLRAIDARARVLILNVASRADVYLPLGSVCRSDTAARIPTKENKRTVCRNSHPAAQSYL